MAADAVAEPTMDSQLTGHVSQAADEGHLFSPPSSPSPPEAAQHPYNFDFPTLEDDGSVSDLTTHQARSGPYATPPAALSALGNKSMADRGYMSESEGSLADQYDMIDHDDLSEISNDDHDTASITSNEQEHDGRFTPELPESEQEEDEAQYVDTALEFQDVNDSISGTASNLPSSSLVMVDSSTAQQIQAENELIDSYMSDDLETPRQSVLPVPVLEPKGHTAASQAPLKILFVSNEDEPQADMDLIISRVTAAMRPSSSDAANHHKVVRLPPTPAAADSTAMTVVYGPNGVEATVQHCVAAKRQSFGSYALCLVDHDGFRHPWVTVSANGKIDGQKPDLIIFHARDYKVEVVLEAVRNVNVPSFAILEKEASVYSKFRGSRKSKVVKGADFIAMDRAALSSKIGHLVRAPTNKSLQGRVSWGIPSVKSFAAVSAIAALIFAMFFAAVLSPGADLAGDLARDVLARREALSSSLVNLSSEGTLPNATSLVDIDELLPECVERPGSVWCETGAAFEWLPPHHVMLSLLRHSNHSRPVVPKFSRFSASNRSGVAFHIDELIAGVYLLTIDPSEVYGAIEFNVSSAKPLWSFSAINGHHGRRKSNDKADTEVGTRIGNDIASMSKTVQKLNGILSHEIAASVQATRNVTSQLALYMSRELQVFGKTTGSMLHKAGRANKEVAETFVKDLTVIQQDVVKFTKDVSLSVKSSMMAVKSSTKALIQSPLARSRQRVQELKQALQSKKIDSEAANADEVGRVKIQRRLRNAMAKFEAKYKAARPYSNQPAGSKALPKVPNRCTKTGKIYGQRLAPAAAQRR
ncbi:hypothetical protein CBER1_06530 [Cercospora berteroae]|uniref:Uncharacterized protein n=1 Tax=Cercospora berteroae TaxID=357750 RepID=A0A2S6BTX6_9PEZI|nr:hypothetical protein CBER1_06530 [Cercospora berteroae]